MYATFRAQGDCPDALPSFDILWPKSNSTTADLNAPGPNPRICDWSDMGGGNCPAECTDAPGDEYAANGHQQYFYNSPGGDFDPTTEVFRAVCNIFFGAD